MTSPIGMSKDAVAERLIVALESATTKSEDLTHRVDELQVTTAAETAAVRDEGNRRARRTSIALLVLLVLVAGVAYGVWRQQQNSDDNRTILRQQQTILKQQDRINAQQACINRANEKRAEDALLFYTAEYLKVDGQYVSFLNLRDASLHGDQKAAYSAFDHWLKATGKYRDGAVSKKLLELGVKIVANPDGSHHLILPPPSQVAPACSTAK